MDEKPIIIAAVDNQGGISKQHKIPWNYSEDMKWFKNRTEGSICVMGRHTYEEINQKTNDKLLSNVFNLNNPKPLLRNRECYVVSNTLDELPNAHVIKHWRECYRNYNYDKPKPVFVIGGQKLYKECIALVNVVILTIINKDYQCDKFFPVEYLMKHFSPAQTFKSNDEPDLRFVVWHRNNK